MNVKRRVLSFTLAAALCLCLLPTAQATETYHRYSVISAGASHSLAVREDGSIWAWGSNDSKQAVPASNAQGFTKPTKVTGASSAISVAAGSDFSAALLDNGTVNVWGGGNGVSTVPGLTGVSSISAGNNLLALKQDGTVWLCQWPFGASDVSQVGGLANIVAISAGSSHYLALHRSGQVWAWGSNSSGQLGTGSAENRVDTPTLISGLSDIISIAAGYNHSLAVDFSGQVYAWGDNSSGQLGNGTTTSSHKPKAVLEVRKAVQVSAGNKTSMALTSDNRVYTWGDGEFGQLGTFSNSNSASRPSTIAHNAGTVLAITSGMYHNMLLNDRGLIYVWGRNRDGQLGTDQNANATTARSISLNLSDRGGYTLERYNTGVAVGASGWAVNDLTSLYNRGIAPLNMWDQYGQDITRAEFAHLVVTVYEQVRNTPITVTTQAKFADIRSHPLRQSILKAYDCSLVRGLSDTQFDPNGKVTRQQAAVFLCTLVNRLQGVSIPSKAETPTYYSDAALIAPWAIPYVTFAHDQNIMLGSDGKFNPELTTTREQALAMVARLADRYGWS